MGLGKIPGAFSKAVLPIAEGTSEVVMFHYLPVQYLLKYPLQGAEQCDWSEAISEAVVLLSLGNEYDSAATPLPSITQAMWIACSTVG